MNIPFESIAGNRLTQRLYHQSLLGRSNPSLLTTWLAVNLLEARQLPEIQLRT